MAEQLKLVQLEPQYWVLEYTPVVFTNEALFESAYSFFDTDPKTAERIYRQVIANCGEDYIDAMTHLGLLLNKHSLKGSSTMYIIQGFLRARLLFPDEFVTGRDLLAFNCVNNRQILHAYYAMGHELIKVKKLGQARDLFDFLVQINPTDEQNASAWRDRIQQAIDHTGSSDLSTPPSWDFLRYSK